MVRASTSEKKGKGKGKRLCFASLFSVSVLGKRVHIYNNNIHINHEGAYMSSSIELALSLYHPICHMYSYCRALRNPTIKK